MAFNKNKALESALKFLNQGKLPQAIGEYQQILRHDPKDQATLMTVGDLYARQGDMTHAAEYFERLAQVYLGDGFNSKAIAIYKKIAKLAPAELAPLERLADLYVQQGVLSEARPLFLQIAEAHLKANRSQRAVEVLHRLLDVEPENPRVQMRLAELYNVMGQKKEAAQTYLNYAQRLLDRGEFDEVHKLAERALGVDPGNAGAVLLQGRAFAAAKQNDEAVRALSTHPEADAGGEVTEMLINLELESGHAANAVERARKRLATGHAHFAELLKVTDALIEAGRTDEALPLLSELRTPMIEASEQDKFLKSLTNLTQRAPESTAALELLVDFCRYTSDPFRLNAALGQLADAYEKKGDYKRAQELLQELADRNKDDERVIEKLNQIRARTGQPTAAAEPAEPVVSAPIAVEPTPPVELATPVTSEPVVVEEPLEEETQQYIAQALTDVDLFSSYGLTQKATHLLENVLQRAPRHTPTLERLLDLYLGAGNERRTAETAALLEQIHRQRNDIVAAEHFGEMRKRFQNAAGLGEHELPTAPPPPATPPPAPAASEAGELVQAVSESPSGMQASARPVEFEIPLAPLEPQTELADHRGSEAASIFAPSASASDGPVLQRPAGGMEEVDLSDEWEAMAHEVSEPAEAAQTADAPSASADEAAEPSVTEPSVTEPSSLETSPSGVEPAEAEQQPVEAHAAPEAVAPAPGPTVEQAAGEPEQTVDLLPVEIEQVPPDATIELIEEAASESAASANGDLAVATREPHAVEQPAEPVHAEAPPRAPDPASPLTTDDFISQLVAELDAEIQPPEVDLPLAQPSAAAAERHVSLPAQAAPQPVASAPAQPMAPATTPVASASVPPPPPAQAVQPPAARPAQQPAQAPQPEPEVSAETLNELSEVFQEFRSELGELEDADEDLETHYNLGIAYREMGLLDEAIGEFQRVAKAIQKGKPFAYAMNCSTMLALCFMDKSEPKIASLWYRRALETPGLDHESVLALRYDLAIALEAAGDARSALDSFQQVYAMNIDYRDVADRIASLQRHETHV